MSLPARVRAEVKFTTGGSVTVPAREIDALRQDGATGVLAVLFRSGDDDDTDGRWQLLEGGALATNGKGDFCATREHVVRSARTGSLPEALRERIESFWPPIVQAFLDEALAGQDVLKETLTRASGDGTVASRLPGHVILRAEHLGHLDEIVHRHRESVAGGIFQVLFAYLLGHVGYPDVTLNPIGVPDVEASRAVTLPSLTPEEVDRLVVACRTSGEDALACRLEAVRQPLHA